MNKSTCSALLWMLLFSATAFGQAKVRKMPSVINHPSLDLYSPYISLDGNALLFVSNSGQDGALTVSYTSRESDWTVPVEIPKHLNTRLNFLRGYSLSADGRKMYITCAKSPTIGGYDIFEATLTGTSWSQPQNLLLPINSKSNDGCPSFTADGNTVYFMRCDKMDQNKASGCKIFQAKKKPNGQWEEPVELPAQINTGNSQTPRIMADGETLIFSTDKIPGKGGMDLFISKLANGTWSEPIALDFVNSEKDDQFVSVSALGRYLIKEAPGARKNSELTEYLIPDNIRPKGMMKVEGKITDPSGAAIPAYIAALDLTNSKRFYTGRPAADGSYFFYLKEGAQYELAFDPEESSMTFYSKRLDLTTDKIPQKEKINVTLKPLSAGDELVLDLVTFKPYSSELTAESAAELKRLVRIAKANPNQKLELQVLLSGYAEDSVQSAPDLTELRRDTITTKFQDVDTLGQLVELDTVIVKTFYHNDRTQAQAEHILEFLTAQGVPPGNLTYLVNAIAAPPDKRKLVVKAVAR